MLQILINVQFSYYAFSTILFPFMMQRTKSKLVVARPSKVTETLLKYIPIKAIPVKYGGLKRDGDDTQFSGPDTAEIAKVVIKASATETIEIEAAALGILDRCCCLSKDMLIPFAPTLLFSNMNVSVSSTTMTG